MCEFCESSRALQRERELVRAHLEIRRLYRDSTRSSPGTRALPRRVALLIGTVNYSLLICPKAIRARGDLTVIHDGYTDTFWELRIKIEISHPFVFPFRLIVTSQVIYGFHFCRA